jgi:hypothetical protein
MAEQGLRLMENYDSDRKEALQEMFELYTFIEKEFSVLIERWEREKAQQGKE